MPTETLQYAQEMLELWRAAERRLAHGAKSYKIGARELTYQDIAEVRRWIDYWAERVEVLQGTKSARTSYQVVPRDL